MENLSRMQTIYDQAHTFADLLIAIEGTSLLVSNFTTISQFLDYLFHNFNHDFIYANESAIDKLRYAITNIHDRTFQSSLMDQLINVKI